MSVTVSPPNAPQADDGGRLSAAPLARAAFGQFLAGARHRSGLTIDDVSATTKVAIRHLEALEQGDIDQLPGGVYRRAWVKSYAAAVGLPPDAALEQFDRLCAPPPAPAERRPATPAPRPRPSRRPPVPTREAVHRYGFVHWLLPAAVLLVAAAWVAPLLRSQPGAPAVGGDSTVLTGESGTDAATPGKGSRSSDIALVPEEIPEEPMPDPRLVITSRPTGARVTVNGIGWGVTPITIRNLPPGPKLIRATKDGYIGRETSVEFGLAGADETVRLVLRPQD
jgi:hypothetical protein